MKRISTSLLILLLIACGPSPEEQPALSEAGTNKDLNTTATAVDISQVKAIIKERCSTCHSSQPSDDIFKVAPSNVLFDTLEQTQRYAARIHARAVVTQTMPPFANKTQMTETERVLLGEWIKAGAPIE